MKHWISVALAVVPVWAAAQAPAAAGSAGRAAEASPSAAPKLATLPGPLTAERMELVTCIQPGCVRPAKPPASAAAGMGVDLPPSPLVSIKPLPAPQNKP